MKSITNYFNLTGAVAIAILMALTMHSFSADPGEAAKGRLPAGNAIHLKRLGSTVDKAWQYQLFQNGIDVKPDDDYVLTFWARASGTFDFNVSTKVSAPPWGFFGLREAVQLTPEWLFFTLKFNAKDAVAGQTRVTFSFLNPEPCDVWIADIRLQTQNAAPDSKENLISNPQFNDGLAKWYVDGKQDGVFDAEVQPVAEVGAPAKK
ncbi:MAG: hypothetical protein WCD79_17090 [Chthoniobacteraceae bacterium]